MALENLDPAVRIEEILDGQDIEPATRLEYFLKKAAEGGGGSGLPAFIPEEMGASLKLEAAESEEKEAKFISQSFSSGSMNLPLAPDGNLGVHSLVQILFYESGADPTTATPIEALNFVYDNIGELDKSAGTITYIDVARLSNCVWNYNSNTFRIAFKDISQTALSESDSYDVYIWYGEYSGVAAVWEMPVGAIK